LNVRRLPRELAARQCNVYGIEAQLAQGRVDFVAIARQLGLGSACPLII